MNIRSPAQMAGFAMRSASLGSRFVFVIYAAIKMAPIDFGIYGLIASASSLIVQLAGLELYQIVLRSVAKSDAALADDRAHYGRFMVAAATAAAIAGAGFGLYFGWSPEILALAAVVCAAEYVGTEAQRICVVENRADLAMFSVSLRYLPWNLGLPVAGVLGFMPDAWWSIETVLIAWLACSVGGSLFLIFVGKPYVAMASAPFRAWFKTMSRQIPRWVLIALCYRFLETGVRLVPGVLIDERAAGHFVLFATLASIGSTGVKAALEPFWFVRLIRAESGAKARREFAIVTIAWLVLAALASSTALIVLQSIHRLTVGPKDWALFAVLVIASAFLSLSQIPHFALYAAERDLVIQRISGVVLIVAVIAAIVGTAVFGLIGAAIGTAIGSGMLLTAKTLAARRIGPATPPSHDRIVII